MQKLKKNWSSEPTLDVEFMALQKKEPAVCSNFGCGRVLHPTEQLFGSKCGEHSKEKRVDIMNVIKWPETNGK